MAGALDRSRQLPLVGGTNSRNPPGQNPGSLRNELREDLSIFEVDIIDLLSAKLAKFPSSDHVLLLLPFLENRFGPCQLIHFDSLFRGLGRRRSRTLLPFCLAAFAEFLCPLQIEVGADRQESDNRLGDLESAFHLGNCRGAFFLQSDNHVIPFMVLAYPEGQPAFTPLVNSNYFGPLILGRL